MKTFILFLLLFPLSGFTRDVNFAWSASSTQDIIGYKIYVGYAPGTHTYYTETVVDPSAVSKTVTGLPEDAVLYAIVKAYAGNRTSPASNEIVIPGRLKGKGR